MAFLKNLFGNRTADAPIQIKTATPVPAAAAPAAVPPSQPAGEMVKVFDEYGRVLEIPRAAWRTQVLLPNLSKKRNDPEGLTDLIVSALRDGYAEDVLQASGQRVP